MKINIHEIREPNEVSSLAKIFTIHLEPKYEENHCLPHITKKLYETASLCVNPGQSRLLKLLKNMKLVYEILNFFGKNLIGTEFLESNLSI